MCKQIKNHPLCTAGFQEHMLTLLLAARAQFVLQAVATGQHCVEVEEESARMPQVSASPMCDLRVWGPGRFLPFSSPVYLLTDA